MAGEEALTVSPQRSAHTHRKRWISPCCGLPLGVDLQAPSPEHLLRAKSLKIPPKPAPNPAVGTAVGPLRQGQKGELGDAATCRVKSRGLNPSLGHGTTLRAIPQRPRARTRPPRPPRTPPLASPRPRAVVTRAVLTGQLRGHDTRSHRPNGLIYTFHLLLSACLGGLFCNLYCSMRCKH